MKQCIRCLKALNRTTVAYIWIPGRNISIKPLKNERWRSAHHHVPPAPLFFPASPVRWLWKTTSINISLNSLYNRINIGLRAADTIRL